MYGQLTKSCQCRTVYIEQFSGRRTLVGSTYIDQELPLACSCYRSLKGRIFSSAYFLGRVRVPSFFTSPGGIASDLRTVGKGVLCPGEETTMTEQGTSLPERPNASMQVSRQQACLLLFSFFFLGADRYLCVSLTEPCG